jgi:hypothetical protein
MPTTKSFEHTIRFLRIPINAGQTVDVPMITASLIQPSGNRVGLPLLFDTGASTTTLRHDLFPLLGLARWDVGQPVDTLTAGGANPVKSYRYRARIEVFGKAIDCAVQLSVLPRNTPYVGLLGREDIFREFGFGFWESTTEPLATTAP